MRPVEVFRTVLDLLVLYDGSGIISLLEAGRVHDQRLDRASGLPVALECAVQRKARVNILRPSADHGHNLSGAVVNTNSRSLHLVLSVVRRIGKLLEFIVHTGLQLLLHVHIKGCIDLVTAFVELGEAGVVEFVVYFLIRRALFVTGKVIAECEVRVLDLHEDFRRALISIRENISILIEGRSGISGEIQHDLFLDRLVAVRLRNHAVLEHVL